MCMSSKQVQVDRFQDQKSVDRHIRVVLVHYMHGYWCLHATHCLIVRMGVYR